MGKSGGVGCKKEVNVRLAKRNHSLGHCAVCRGLLYLVNTSATVADEQADREAVQPHVQPLSQILAGLIREETHRREALSEHEPT